MLASQKKYSEAATEFQTAFEDSGNDPRIAVISGQNYLRMKEYDKARSAFEAAVKDSQNPVILASAYNNLAWIACETEKDLNQGLSWATKANELRPNDPNILDTLGWALFKLKRYSEARDRLTSAVALNANDPLVRYHLGKALLAEGEKDAALRSFKNALALSATFDGAEDATRIIAELEGGSAPSGDAAPR
jgi:tetratricopeptide (TPR) repeat protein